MDDLVNIEAALLSAEPSTPHDPSSSLVANRTEVENIAEGESKGFRQGNQSWFVVRYNNALYAYLNSCPHLGIELEWQPDRFLDPDKQFIQCSSHGALFLMDSGECISGPCIGQSLRPLSIQEKEDQVVFRPIQP